MEKRIVIRWIVIILIVILLLLAPLVYFTYFYHKSCDNYECFRSYLAKCSKAQFLSDSAEATWFYKIEGKSSNGECNVYTELRQIKKTTIEYQSLENSAMNCYLPYGVVISPESDLGKCSGPLKEQMQEIIIQRLHSYILGNIGNITDELKKVI
jgi:hypothetical protein